MKRREKYRLVSNNQKLIGFFAVIAAVFSAGCQSLNYYTQAAAGQAGLMWNSRPIVEVIHDPATSPHLKDRLLLISDIRAFAERDLSLPASGSYQRYTDIGREFVLWSLVAAEEFSVAPELFCFPIVGCMSYLGFFEEGSARDEAARLRAKGLEVVVGPVAAYSTLGWFSDPVLSSVLDFPDTELAGLIFHELAHERLFIKDDSTFNESFASFVEREGVAKWLREQGREVEVKQYAKQLAKRDQLIDLIQNAREKLKILYAGGISNNQKRLHKSYIFDDLKKSYQLLRDAGKAPNWDYWFKQNLNNAGLISVGTYFDQLGFFEQLFDDSRQDFDMFYKNAEIMGKGGE